MTSSRSLEPEDLLITPRLYSRRPRAAVLERELNAYRELSSLMASSPSEAIQRFLELAIELCPAAGSAGLSELGEEKGEPIFRWTAMSGAFARYVGGSTPRDFSPCGLCLASHHTILLERPARVFEYFRDAEPQIFEGLIVPLYDTGKRPIGTLWVVSHIDGAKFDPTDARIMEQLAVQLVLAIKLRRKASIAAKLEAAARDNEVLVREVRHRVKNMIQMTASLLELQERGADSGQARVALREAQNRLMVLSSVYEKLLSPNADARQVDVSELIHALVHALCETGARGTNIDVEISCDHLQLGVSEAVALGLIVNEVVTNSLKHAFDAGSTGKIIVQLARDGAECLLKVSDNGRGINGGSRSGSLGMRLINTLAGQLAATVVIDGSSGTSVSLRWTPQPTISEEPTILLAN